MAPPNKPHIVDMPVEILRYIARELLSTDLPVVGARGLLLPDSYVDALRNWRDVKLSRVPRCTPYLSCHSKRGARIHQTVMCFEQDTGPARSSLDLRHVCHKLREVVLEDSLFWANALLLHPIMLDQALDRALSVDLPNLAFVAHGGACLCVLDFILENFGDISRLDLSLPSTTSADNDSPSRMILEELQKGAPQLVSVDLRFDWAHSHPDALQKAIVALPAVTFCRLMNATFAIVGATLTRLFMAAEDSVFRWRRGDIYKALENCPNLETVALQMIMVDIDTIPVNQIMEFRQTVHVSLPHLTYFHLSDKRLEWTHAAEHIHVPMDTRMHADVILPMSQVAHYSLATFQHQCESAVVSRNLTNIGQRHPTMALRYKRSVHHATGWKWPEYIAASFGDDMESAMAFRDPVSQASSGSFTVRNAALSLVTTEEPWLHLMPGGMAAWCAIDAFLRASGKLGIPFVQTFVVDCTATFVCPDSWREIFMHMPDLRCIVILGIKSFSSSHVATLASALATVTHVIDDDENAEQSVMTTYPCMQLQTVRLPSSTDAVPQDGVAILRGILRVRYKDVKRKIDWVV